MTRWMVGLALALAACGGRSAETNTLSPGPESPAARDSLWREAETAVRHADWGDAVKLLPRVLLQLNPEDPRQAVARYYLGEAHFARGDHLEAVREFRRVVDDLPEDRLAPDALLRVGDTYAAMWRRPELDPTYGSNALGAYEELVARYPNSLAARRAQTKIVDLNNRFAYKAFRNAMYYYRLKAYDSAILYLRDLIATYPRTSTVPAALDKLLEAYEKLGYKENVRETCGYVRQYHAKERQIMHRCAGVPESTASS